LVAVQTMVQSMKSDHTWTNQIEIAPFLGDNLASADTLLKYVTGPYLTNGTLTTVGGAASGYFVNNDYHEQNYIGGIKCNGDYGYFSFHNSFPTTKTNASMTVYTAGTGTFISQQQALFEPAYIMGWVDAFSDISTLQAKTTNDDAVGGIYGGSTTTYAPTSPPNNSDIGYLSVTASNLFMVLYTNGIANGAPVAINGGNFNNIPAYVGALYNQKGSDNGPQGFTGHYIRYASYGNFLTPALEVSLANDVSNLQVNENRPYTATSESGCSNGIVVDWSGFSQGSTSSVPNLSLSTHYAGSGMWWYNNQTIYSTNLWPGGFYFATNAYQPFVNSFSICGSGALNGSGNGVGLVSTLVASAGYTLPVAAYFTYATNKASFGQWIEWNYNYDGNAAGNDIYTVRGLAATPIWNIGFRGPGSGTNWIMQLELDTVAAVNTSVSFAKNNWYWVTGLFDTSSADSGTNNFTFQIYNSSLSFLAGITNIGGAQGTTNTPACYIQYGFQLPDSSGNTNDSVYYGAGRIDLTTAIFPLMP